MTEQIRCPDCKRRMVDVSGDWVSVSMTCPRCRTAVTVTRELLAVA